MVVPSRRLPTMNPTPLGITLGAQPGLTLENALFELRPFPRVSTVWRALGTEVAPLGPGYVRAPSLCGRPLHGHPQP
jgi:hypothetical protein